MIRKILWTLIMLTFVVIPNAYAFEPITMTTALAALAAAGGTAGVGAGIASLFGKKKKPQQAGFNYYESPHYQALKSLLMPIATGGIPEIGRLARQGFTQETLPQIRELYEAKKNLGTGATPEVYALGQAGRGLERDIAGQDYETRLRAMQLLSGLSPTTTFTEEEPPMWQNLLQFGAPIASTALSSYQQTQGMKDIMKMLSGAGSQRVGMGSMGGFRNPYEYNPLDDEKLISTLFNLGLGGGY